MSSLRMAIMLVIVLISMISAYIYSVMSVYNSFINGFWVMDIDDVNIVMYIDTSNNGTTNHSRMIVSKNDAVVVDLPMSATVSHRYVSSPLEPSFDISFTIDNAMNKYAKLLNNKTLYMDLFIDAGYMYIYDSDDNEIMSLVKDNMLNYTMMEYIIA